MTDAVSITPEWLRLVPLPAPEPGAGKDARGRVLVVGGAVATPGAALLAGIGALRVGAGKVRIATCERNASALAVAFPESYVVALPETGDGEIDPGAAEGLGPQLPSCRAVIVGPGLADKKSGGALAMALIEEAASGEQPPTLLVDASALVGLRPYRERLARGSVPLVFTPHAGEMAGLLGLDREEIEADPLPVARRAARDMDALVVLKGRCTFIAAPDGRAWRSEAGNVGLATAGSGDVLAGFMAGLLARGATPEVAAAWAVFLHGTAAERIARRRGVLGFLARELLEEAPPLLAEMTAT